MSIVTIQNGGLIGKDPDASKVYVFDWDTNSLALGVTIVQSVWEITALAPSTSDIALTTDNPSVLAGARKTQARFVGGTPGQLYEIENTITTSETPAQVKVGTFRVLVEG